MLSLAVSLDGMSALSRDITQAYIQAEIPLEWKVHIAPPEEIEISTNKVLNIIQPLYTMSESGLHRYLTYIDHHTNKLGTTRACTAPRLLYRHEQGTLKRVVILQADDRFIAGSEFFLEWGEEEAKQFVLKPRKVLKNEPVLFNGIHIAHIESDANCIAQSDKVDELTTPHTEVDVASQRALN